MRDEEVHVSGAPEATETSPLIGAEVPDANDGKAVKSNGTFADSASGSSTAGDVIDNAENSGVPPGPGDEVVREGLPEMAAKMHLLLPALGIGLFLCALDQLLAVATYAKIGSDLKALNSTSWIATAYFSALTCCQPLYGKLSDIFGRKECLLFAYAIFAVGSLGCGLAQNIVQLIVARGVAGIGGGGMNAVVSILLTDIVPLRDRGIWQGYMNIIFATGTATGAPLGGLLAESVGWRWSFLGQVPFVIVAFVAVYFVLDLPRKDTSHWRAKLAKVDFLGAFFLVAAVLCLLAGLDNGSNDGWRRASTAAPLAAAPVLVALFVLVEMRVASHPFAPGHIIFERSLFACFLCNFFGMAGQMPVLFFLPLVYQAVDGLSAVQAGLLLIPGSVAGVAASLGGGFVIRQTGRYYWITVASFGLLLFSVVPLLLFSGLVVDSELGSTVALALVATGSGAGITTTLIGLISNAAREDAAIVIACSYLFRALGSSIGVSAGSAVLQQVLRTQLAARLGDDDNDAARAIEERVRESLDYIRQLEPRVADVVRACYQTATLTVFASCAVPLALSFVLAFFIREKKVGK